MSQASKRVDRVRQVNEVGLLFVLLVGALLFAYLALGFGGVLVESIDRLPWTIP